MATRSRQAELPVAAAAGRTADIPAPIPGLPPGPAVQRPSARPPASYRRRRGTELRTVVVLPTTRGAVNPLHQTCALSEQINPAGWDPPAADPPPGQPMTDAGERPAVAQPRARWPSLTQSGLRRRRRQQSPLLNAHQLAVWAPREYLDVRNRGSYGECRLRRHDVRE